MTKQPQAASTRADSSAELLADMRAEVAYREAVASGDAAAAGRAATAWSKARHDLIRAQERAARRARHAGRCPADWGSATPSQRCVLPAGHSGNHMDEFRHYFSN
jgi:hypothetical protein